MRSLRLVALSDDGKSVVLAADGPDGEGERFELPIDDRLRAAARGDARRLTQIDVDLGTELPPRVIQARIRAGETPEQVAAASGARVERIMRFAHPVIQERERVAEQAREARVRLSEGSPGLALQQFMVERLRLIDFDVEPVSWDAFRGDDGTWVVTALWRTGDKSGMTRWSFDIPSRTVTPADATTLDFAEGTRLVRVVPEVPAGPQPGPVHRSRPVSVLHDTGEIEDHESAAITEDLTREVPAELPRAAAPVDDHVRDVHPSTGAPEDERSLDELLDEVAEHDTVVLAREEGDDGEDPRARIPAWEDIVFGVRRHR
jgi:Protein of unknown function (DUF3071)